MQIFLILVNLLLYNVKEIPVSVSTGTSGRKLGTGGRIGGSMHCKSVGLYNSSNAEGEHLRCRTVFGTGNSSLVLR